MRKEVYELLKSLIAEKHKGKALGELLEEHTKNGLTELRFLWAMQDMLAIQDMQDMQDRQDRLDMQDMLDRLDMQDRQDRQDVLGRQDIVKALYKYLNDGNISMALKKMYRELELELASELELELEQSKGN